MFRILLVSQGSSGISLMAGAFGKRIFKGDFELTCAAELPRKVDPVILNVMKEIDYELPAEIPLSLESVKSRRFDAVIALCDGDVNHKMCDEFLGSPALIRWFISDASVDFVKLTVKETVARRLRDDIRNKIVHFVNDGYLNAIRDQCLLLVSLIENLVDGVMAHDEKRRILFFNRAAQRITGYSYSDVINRDCHEVFIGRFCGGDCAFCDIPVPESSRVRYYNTFLRKDGRLLDLEMSSISISTSPNDVITTLIVFRDLTKSEHERRQLPKLKGFHGIIGNTPAIEKIYDTIREVANINVPVLIQGESGTGKELVANAIHKLSSRAPQPFVPVNCGALPEGTLESELFGHVKGAFTGAIRDRKGRFELADGGTIFLDEIGEISPAMQVKLLRVLQEKSFIPVGGERAIHIDVRVLCATNKDLREMVKLGLFREDLYYRIVVVPILIPPLRDRTADIPLLVEHFLNKFTLETGRSVTGISANAMMCLVNSRWPGNIRELANSIQYALIKCHGSELDVEHLPQEIINEYTMPERKYLGRRLKLSTEIVAEAMHNSGGNKSKAARLLGVTRPTLYNFLKKSNNDTFTEL